MKLLGTLSVGIKNRLGLDFEGPEETLIKRSAIADRFAFAPSFKTVEAQFHKTIAPSPEIFQSSQGTANNRQSAIAKQKDVAIVRSDRFSDSVR